MNQRTQQRGRRLQVNIRGLRVVGVTKFGMLICINYRVCLATTPTRQQMVTFLDDSKTDIRTGEQ